MASDCSSSERVSPPSGQAGETRPFVCVIRCLIVSVVRGGRFVSGFNGEQYALPEAVDALRRVRRQERNGERVWVSAIDPVNLVGVVVPGEKVPALAGRGILYVDGLPLAIEAETALPSASGRPRVALTAGGAGPL